MHSFRSLRFVVLPAWLGACVASDLAVAPVATDAPIATIRSIALELSGGTGALDRYIRESSSYPVDELRTRVTLTVKSRTGAVDTSFSLTLPGSARVGTTTVPATEPEFFATSSGLKFIANQATEARVQVSRPVSLFPTEEFVQAGDATVRVEEYSEPRDGVIGFIRGSVTFLADRYIRRYGPSGEMFIHRQERGVLVQARFSQALAYEVHRLPSRP